MTRRAWAAIIGLALIAGFVLARPLGVPKVRLFARPAPMVSVVPGSVDMQGQEASLAQGGPVRQGTRAEDAEEDHTIAYVTTHLLAKYHYLHHPIDAETSGKLMDRYIEALDPLHVYFLKSDLDEFAPLRQTMGTQLWEKGDTAPATQIFARFLKRFDENFAYANELLKQPPPELTDFTSNDTFVLDRKDLPPPQSMDEARHLWLERLRYEYLQEKLSHTKPEAKPEEIVKTLTRRYARTHQSILQLDHDDVFEIYLTSLCEAYDPHSGYMGRASVANFDITMSLSLVGIGAQLLPKDGYTTIQELIPGGPAMKSGKLKPGDRIVAVAQAGQPPVDVVDMKIDNVVAMIRGKKGTEVRITVIPAGAPDPSTRKTVTLIRDDIKLEAQEAKAKIIDVPGSDGKTSRIGVIDVPSFYEDTERRGQGGKSTTADVARLLTKLKAEHIQGLVLDLRRNPGGSLTEAINLTGLFISPGPVVQVRDSDGQVKVDKDTEPGPTYSGPLVVLTSRLSASASEILAGALQDYGRAVIVGDTSTHGKGSVQTVIQLGPILESRGAKLSFDPGALRLTIEKFYRPSGSSTQLRGVVPDIILPSLTSAAAPGEKSLPNAMQWDTIPSSSYSKVNAVQPYLAELRKRSDARVASDKDFAYLQDAIAQFKKTQADKAVSLNEAQRLKEKQEAEARAEAWKKRAQSRPESKEKVILLTVEEAGRPGLPPPVGKTTARAGTGKPSASDLGADDTLGLDGGGGDAPLRGGDALVNDISLQEANRILLDLISLSSKTPGTDRAVAGAIGKR